jgi:hypothetical protein
MNKLYVLVREDLSPAQQAVQAGHAVAEYLLRGPEHKWDNGTLIYLGVPNEERLQLWKDKLEARDVPFVVFREPDIDNEITALSSIPTNQNIFKNLSPA